jgi:hypothetical protein
MIKIPILMYHMVSKSEDAREKQFCCHPKAFKRQMAYLKKAGYEVVGKLIKPTNKFNRQSLISLLLLLLMMDIWILMKMLCRY